MIITPAALTRAAGAASVAAIAQWLVGAAGLEPATPCL
jgi:hypothetical protein